ncbi:tyrosine-type recombinase/integrase [Agrobacterium sp. 22-221-1]
MARQLHKLTARGIDAALKAGDNGVLRDGGGLSLVIDRFGARWLFGYTSPVTSKRREMGFGSYTTGGVTLAFARDRASECRALIADGKDPLIERDVVSAEARRASVTFGDLAKDTRAVLSKRWTSESVANSWDRAIKELPKLVKMLAKDIRSVDVANALSVYDDRPARKAVVLSIIKRTMDTAVAAEIRIDNPAIPARISRLTSLDWQKGHNAAMPYTEVPAFVKSLQGHGSRAARCLELIIRTGVRKGEATDARWDEIDFAKGIWTIPEERTKQRREHVVPLTHRVLEILREQHAIVTAIYNQAPTGANASVRDPASIPAHVWADNRYQTISSSAFDHLETKGATVHGFRSSLREFLGDETSVSWNTAEEVLGHKVGDSTAKAYRRASGIAKRLAALQYWNDFLDGVSNKNVNTDDETPALQVVEGNAA